MSPDIRETERLLRAGGFSRRQARALLAGGWRMMETGRAPVVPVPAMPPVDDLRRLADAIRVVMGA